MDDGSGVVAVHHVYRQCTPTPAIQRGGCRARPSKKGKERQRDEVVGGIPSEYLLPPPPVPQAPGVADGRAPSKLLTEVASYFEVGDLVSVVGRLELWVDRRERIVFVDTVLHAGEGQETASAEHEGFLQAVQDASEEPRHLLRSLLLSATEYSSAFQAPEEQLAWPKDGILSRPCKPKRKLYGTEAVTQSDCVVPRRTLRVMGAAGESPRKHSLGIARQLMPSGVADKEQGIKRRAASSDVERPSKRQDAVKRATREAVASTSPHAASPSSTTGPARRPQRQLRSYEKLSDAKMTESTFRVYVEKHLVDCCSIGMTEGPPAFTLSYLHRVTLLRRQAQRTVEVAARRREEKRRRRASAADKASDLEQPPGVSGERVWDKIVRLYASVVRALLMDGIIVLASSSCTVTSPFNGRPVSRLAAHSFPHLDWDEMYDEAPSLDVERGYRSVRMREEAYQVVTPALLATPLLQAISRTANTLSSTLLAQKLQAADERWRFIQADSVLDTLEHLRCKAGEQRVDVVQ